MTDAEVNLKLAVIGASVLGVIAVGFLILYVIIPVFLVAAAIDFTMRQSYNGKLAIAKSAKDLVTAPDIRSFEARLVDGEVLLAWMVDLPGDARLDIYRVTAHGGGSIDELEMRGSCIHSTGLEFTSDMDSLFRDIGLADDTYYYVPVVSGAVVEKTPLVYHLFDFAKEVQYRTRRTRRVMRGEAVPVVVAPEVIEQIPDLRDEPSRIADDVVAHIRSRHQFDNDLDAAIARISSNEDLTEAEKQEAIELLETRASPI